LGASPPPQWCEIAGDNRYGRDPFKTTLNGYTLRAVWTYICPECRSDILATEAALKSEWRAHLERLEEGDNVMPFPRPVST